MSSVLLCFDKNDHESNTLFNKLMDSVFNKEYLLNKTSLFFGKYDENNILESSYAELCNLYAVHKFIITFGSKTFFMIMNNMNGSRLRKGYLDFVKSEFREKTSTGKIILCNYSPSFILHSDSKETHDEFCTLFIDKMIKNIEYIKIHE